MMDFLASGWRFGSKSHKKPQTKHQTTTKRSTSGNHIRNLPPIGATNGQVKQQAGQSITSQLKAEPAPATRPASISTSADVSLDCSISTPNGRRSIAGFAGTNKSHNQAASHALLGDPNNNSNEVVSGANVAPKNGLHLRHQPHQPPHHNHSHHNHQFHHQQAATSSSSSGYNSVAGGQMVMKSGHQHPMTLAGPHQHHYAAPVLQHATNSNGQQQQQRQDELAPSRVQVSTFRHHQMSAPTVSGKPTVARHQSVDHGPPMVPLMIDDDDHHHHHHHHEGHNVGSDDNDDDPSHHGLHHGSQPLIDGQFYGFEVASDELHGHHFEPDDGAIEHRGVDCADSLGHPRGLSSIQHRNHHWNGFTYERPHQVQQQRRPADSRLLALNRSLKQRSKAPAAISSSISLHQPTKNRNLHPRQHLYRQASVECPLPVVDLHAEKKSLYHQSSASFVYHQLVQQQQQQQQQQQHFSKLNHRQPQYRAQVFNYQTNNNRQRSQFHSHELLHSRNQSSFEEDDDDDDDDDDLDDEFSDSVEHLNQLHSGLIDGQELRSSVAHPNAISGQLVSGDLLQQASKRQAKANRMQSTGSRQHLTSPDLRQHHSSSKRKSGHSNLSASPGDHVASSRQQQQQHHHQQQYLKSTNNTNVKLIPRSLSSGNAISNNNTSIGQQLELGCCGKFAKFLLFISNALFWLAGLGLGAWGILALVDDHKYNLSQLLVFEPSSRMSLFQLLSWSFITLGCATILVGFCGCSALFKNNRWILGLYIFLILAIFALDLATGLLAIIFQERLVANVRLKLVNKLRNEYGVQASFTAAIDFIQTKYECCGMDGHLDYDQSLWRLQRLGGFEATVARTCCHLRNTFDDQAHVNPRPINESMCQSSDVRFHQSYRYRRGCLDDLERLIRHKIWTFTIGCGAVGAVILISLVFATCFCRSIPSAGSRKSSTSARSQQVAVLSLVEGQTNEAGGKKKHHGLSHYR